SKLPKSLGRRTAAAGVAVRIEYNQVGNRRFCELRSPVGGRRFEGLCTGALQEHPQDVSAFSGAIDNQYSTLRGQTTTSVESWVDGESEAGANGGEPIMARAAENTTCPPACQTRICPARRAWPFAA